MADRRRFHAVVLVAGGLLLGPTAAGAQDIRWGFGLPAGGIAFSDFNAHETNDVSYKLAPGWVAGVQMDRWVGGGRFGFRLNVMSTVRPGQEDGNTLGGSINHWMGDLGLLVRLRSPDPDAVFAPYMAMAPGYFLMSPSFPSVNRTASNVRVPNRSDFWAVAAGLGFDLVPRSGSVGFRMEVNDFIALRSPVTTTDEVKAYGAVHHVRLTAGLHFVGGRSAPRVLAAASPVPPPEPPAQPARVAESAVPAELGRAADQAERDGRPRAALPAAEAAARRTHGLADVYAAIGDRRWLFSGYRIAVNREDQTVTVLDRVQPDSALATLPLASAFILWLDPEH